MLWLTSCESTRKSEVSHLFNEALPHYRELYFHRFPEDECVLNNIATGLAHLQENVALRFERASLYL